MANLTDVRGQYTFLSYTRNGRIYRQAFGWLGTPNQVLTYRSPSAQRKLSADTGDDAGHLIGDRFGSPGGRENLGLQNWKSNRYGTYKDLENTWVAKRLAGIDIYVQVTDASRFGEHRPFMRNVQWIEQANGRQAKFAVDFANPHTPESRVAQNIPATNVGTPGGDVIHVDFRLRQRIP